MTDTVESNGGRTKASGRTKADGRTRGARASAAWTTDVERVRPTVLVLGGFLTLPPMYRRFAARLLRRGVAGVVVAPVWTPDWLISGVRGPGAIATRCGRALLTASDMAAELSGGAPLLVVGHSAGGLVARILTAPEPLPGKRFGAAPRIGAIVTLGTPHQMDRGEGIGKRLEKSIGGVADAAAPGCLHSPSIGYVAVGSRAYTADPAGTGRQRASYVLYRSVIGRAAVPGTEGDGLVPLASARLPGARAVVVDDAIHGPGAGAPWYGTDSPMAVWWPAALAAWREALRYRAGR
jgi:hypothetical protein